MYYTQATGSIEKISKLKEFHDVQQMLQDFKKMTTGATLTDIELTKE